MVRLYKVPLLWVLAGLLAALPTNAVAAAGRHVVHDLDVRLDPTGQRLFGHDRMVVSLAPKRLIVRLSPKAQIESLTIGNQAADWAFSEEGLTVPLPASQGKPAVLTLVYSVIFDDAAPRRPVNTDNPGFGVRGTISERGAVLLAGSGWYPQVAEMARTLNLSVTAPAGILAVTSGRLIGHTTAEGKTVSRWQVNRPIGAVSLCAGPYLPRRKEAGGHVAATYFSRQRQHLADAYLSASLKYLSDYSDRFGPYPFDQFAVVENFFPTGYGFPGFTLLGGRVLDLPFIIPTSLRHEIAHCWWGNGVRVDTSQGNWCEGLVTYVADYAYRAEQGAAAARDYRRQLLRNFTSLVNPGEAIALNRFQSRRDRITKAVGYDKSAFVFHMLHQRLGGGFWQALTDLFRDRCFQEASWTVLASYFQRYADHNLDRFFDQWLARRDAPRLRLEAVAFDPGAGELTGRLVQNAPTYDLSLDLLVVTAGQRRIERIHITGATQSFRLPLESPPRSVVADPEDHLFRRLWPAEMPATINSLKATGEVVVETSANVAGGGRELAVRLPRALGLKRKPSGGKPTEASIWIGAPDHDHLPPGARLENGRLLFSAVEIPPQADTVFAVWSTGGGAGIKALYWSPTLAAAQSVLRKIPHYGNYSYLAFNQATNILKGTWAVTGSPLRVDWPKH